MVYPLLNGTLHTHLHQPVNIIGRGLIIRRTGYQVVDFLLRVFLFGVNAIDLHPRQELLMINDILLERVAHLINIVHMHGCIVGVYLAAAFVNGHKHRLDAAGGLRHQRCGAGGGNGQAGDVAAAMFQHVLIQLRIGLFQSVDKRIVLLAFGIINFKSTTLCCHLHGRPVGIQGQGLVYFYRKLGSLLGAITQPHCCYHIALGRDSDTRPTSHAALAFYLLPEMTLRELHLFALRVAVYLA